MHRSFTLFRFGRTSRTPPCARSSSSHASGPSEPKVPRSNIISRSDQTIRPNEIDSLISRKLFFVPAFKPYRGIEGVELRGLYNYGPPGAELQDNVLDIWRKHFILEEDMLKVDCPAITPYEVFKTSGHVDKFTDFMCRDAVTGEHYRADHLVKEQLGKRLSRLSKSAESTAEIEDIRFILACLDDYGRAELSEVIDRFRVQSPLGNPVEPPTPTNLMFETPIGPSGKARGYLRPETAQGQFLMFQELLEYNNQAMPFASASIGKSYRNEIAPRSGILRLREFLMAEIEHFMDPASVKKHPRFSEIGQLELPLLTREQQTRGVGPMNRGKSMSVEQAVKRGIVDNETLGYFLARAFLFLLKIGIDPWKMRFRQHMANEMAHYAADCWDIELHTSYGWIECVGLADRSAFDLTAHSKRTGEQLEVQTLLGPSREVEEYVPIFNMTIFGPRFKQHGKAIRDVLRSMSQVELAKLAREVEMYGNFTLQFTSGTLTIERDVVTVEKKKVMKPDIRTYTPSVIEPSFGIGRILYALMEHSIDRRPGDDQARLVLSFPPIVAPTKVLIVPLQLNDPRFLPFVESLQRRLRREDISTRIDASGASIGKRYSRNDEVGTPLGITIDFQSLGDQTVTLRDRDTTKQVRGSLDEICQAVYNIVEGREQWADVYNRLPHFESSVEAGDTAKQILV